MPTSSTHLPNTYLQGYKMKGKAPKIRKTGPTKPPMKVTDVN